MPALMLSTGPVSANPSGGIVVHGDINIGNGANGHLQINQNSQRAIINWSDFNIKHGETTRFIQPGANAAVLNRVTGGDPSAIHGALRANGNVFVINPSGIIVGPSGTIDVHGLVLSTLDVDNGEFLAGGDMTFLGNSEAGVINMGRINAIGGDVFLLGNTVENHGQITAREGTVGLGAGREVLLAAKANSIGERVFVRAGGRGNTGVLNTGSIEGAAVELKAHGNMYALAINNKGSVRAVGAVNQGGRVFLRGLGGSISNEGSIEATTPFGANKSANVLIQAAYARVDGTIRADGGSVRIAGTDSVDVRGTVDVSSKIGNGGDVTVEGDTVNIGATAMIDASGSTGGGAIRIGGGFQGRDGDVVNSISTEVKQGALLFSDATESGAGGSVIVWANGDTMFQGDISAQGIDAGGFVEVSGRERLGFSGNVSTIAANGTAGTLLLDPTNGEVRNATQNLSGNPFVISRASLQTALGSNNVVISTPDDPMITDRGTITFVDTVTWNSANSLSVLAHGDIVFNANVQNGGTGALNAIAGWDGSTGFPANTPLQNPGALMITDFLDDSSSYGNEQNGVNGSVYVGSDASALTVAVGSRHGQTTLLGHDLVLRASDIATADRYAQVGYRDVSTGLSSTGDIRIQLNNELSMTAGSGAVRSYAQIGHGGADGTTTTAAGDLSGNIRIDVMNGITMSGGSGSSQNYVQIGHGGFQSGGVDTSHGGDITVVVSAGGIVGIAGTGTDNYVQIGHGGRAARGAHAGNVNLLARDDISFSGSDNARGYAQIGNGGHDADQASTITDKSGAIRVASTHGNVLLQSGAGADAYAQIGNGGLNTDGNHSGATTVRAAGSVSANSNTGAGANGYGQIGNGGLNSMGNHSGAITVTSGTSGTFDDGFDVDGNGVAGEAADAVNFTGDSTGGITFTAGGGTDRYVQLGHGGRTARGDHDGTIDVTAAGDVSFAGGSGTQAYAQLGHGGRDADNPNPSYYPDNDASNPDRGPTAAERIGNSGNINVTSTSGDIRFTAGSASDTWVLLGHGGSFNDGDHVGDIAVSANGDIIFDASEVTGTTHFAQLGHGGYLASGGHTGKISAVAGGDIRFTAGTSGSYAQIGHGGRNDHRIARGGTAPDYVQNNSNDRFFPGTHTGTISVGAGNDILFTSGISTGAYAQIGHGGFRNAAEAGEGHSGDISVVGGGSMTFNAQSGGQANVQIGHGGYEAFGNHGYQVVRAEIGDIAATQVGSASLANSELAAGSIRITIDPTGTGAGTAVFVDDGNGNLIDPSDALGLGVGAIVGSVDYDNGQVAFTENANLAGDAVEVAYLHGGSNILVEAANGIAFSGGTNGQAYAQIGHGGYDSDFSLTRPVRAEEPAPASYTSTTNYHLNTPLANPLGSSGDIVVRVGYDGSFVTNPNAALSFFAGSAADTFAMIGNGGRSTDGDHRGNITVDATGDITFAGGAHQRTFAQLGNGGYDSDANLLTPAVGNRGDIRINTNLISTSIDAMGSISFLAGSGEESYAQLGHGGYGNNGANVGIIDLRSAGDVTFTSGDGSGTGDLDGSGTTFVATEGQGRRSYAQLGHGGYEGDAASTGGLDGVGHRGDISVRSGGDIRFTASLVTDPAAEDYRNYVQLGHGGYAANGDHSGDLVVLADGDIDFTAGGVRASDPIGAPVSFFSHDSYAQLGHGGRETDGYGTADSVAQSGNIRVEAGGRIRFAGYAPTVTGEDFAANDAYTQLGHGGYNADGSQRGNIEVAALGGSIVFDASTSGTDGYSQLGHGGRAGRGDHSGDILVDATGDISFLGGTTLRTYAQLGHGGHDADFNTGDSAKIGNSGDILVNTRSMLLTNAGGISFTAGAGEESFVQLGHGGFGTQGIHTGNLTGLNLIDVRAAGDVSFTSGNGSGIGDDGGLGEGNGRRSFAQLGHGGYDSDAAATGGVDGDGHSADISVNAGGAVTFTATNLVDPLGPDMQANDFRNFVQLGHGGHASNGDHRGDISVIAGNGIAFTAGGVDAAATLNLSQDAYAQIGHGGYVADGYGGSDVLSKQGDIRVEATGGDIIFTGSNATEAYVQIGHGGRDVDGGAQGAISLTALSGAITFNAGSAADNYAQVGHGGRTGRGDREGSIQLAAQGDIQFNAGSSTRTYAQIGHGGHDADFPNNAVGGGGSGTPGNSGDIRVASTDGSVVLTAGTGTDSYAQIGHGGIGTEGDHSGDIVVRAGNHVTGNADAGGSGGNAYAQIGHGGVNAIGSHNGAIMVSAGTAGDFSDVFDRNGNGILGEAVDLLTFTNNGTGGVDFRAGAGTNKYAQLGHGGYQTSVGIANHDGSITVSALESVLFQARTSTRSYAQLGHGGVGATGNNTGAIDVESTAGSINFLWGATNTAPGTDTYVQLGHGGLNAVGNHSGEIRAVAEQNLLFRSTTGGTANGNYAQLGHGGLGAVGNHSGGITAVANTGTAQFRAGSSTTIGSGNDRYAQLGHGGAFATGTHTGNISLVSDGAITLSNLAGIATTRGYTQIGHGGYGAASPVGYSGNISVASRTSSITFTGANGGSDDSYAQLGHGGALASGSHYGNIAVQSGTGISFTGGTDGIRSYAQLGHGGYDADAILGEGHGGYIGVAAGTNLLFTAGSGSSQESYAQLGHGGYETDGDHRGDIVARAGNTFVFTASTGTDTLNPDLIDPINNPPTRLENRGYAQLGHGGFGSSGDRSGSIVAGSQVTGEFADIGDFDGDGFFDTVSLAGGTSTTNPFSFLAGDNPTTEAASDAYAQLGHGGRLAIGTNTGNISVDAERTIRFEAGALGARTYAQLGHGGHDAAPVIDGLNPIGIANSGSITVESRTGAVNLLWGATNTDASDDSYVQLGHGGFVSDPAISGVNAGGHNTGDINLKAGTSLLLRSTTSAVPSAANYVQLGHGGMGWVGNNSGDITAVAGTTVTATAGGGTDRYAKLGHGGTNATGDNSGDIAVLSDGNITFSGTAASVRGYTQLGHGGYNADSLLGHSGNIGVASSGGDLVFTAAGGAQTEGYTQLGHGGFDSAGAHNGSIVARAGDDITFTASGGSAGTGSFSGYAQLGHGGMKADSSTDPAANLSGSITVSSHVEGEFNDIGNFGDITFVDGGGTGGLRFIGGQGTTAPVGADAYAQLGHGGRLNRGAHSGDIQVDADSQILFQAGRLGSRAYVQLGHGGHDSAVLGSGPGTVGNSGSITVNASANLDFRWAATNATTASEIYAQLGHGGYLTDPATAGAAGGDNRGAITVTASNILFRSTTGSTTGGNYVQLGHGGMRWTGNHSGIITVDASGSEAADPTRSIAFIAGNGGADRYAQLGHGGRLAAGDHGLVDINGAPIETITVTGRNDIVFSAGTSARSYAQIGNGGHEADIATAPRGAAANIEVTSTAGSVLVSGGSGDAAYAQIGNGGYANSGSHGGNVTVSADQNVKFLSPQTGTTANAYVQLGNGGRDAVGNHSGDISVSTTSGGIEFASGSANDRYAQLGNGGRGASGNHSGDIDVAAGNGIVFSAFNGAPITTTTTNSTTLNNLLLNDAAANYNISNPNIVAGTVVITYDNPIIANGFTGTITDNGAGQLFDNGILVGTISANGLINLSRTVSSGIPNSVILYQNNNLGQRSYAQLGHGGYDADSAAGSIGNSGEITVDSQNGGVSFSGGSRADTFAQLGHGGTLTNGSHDGAITVQALGSAGGINFTGGSFPASYAQLGHGGNETDGNFTGDISLGTSGDVNLSGREGTDGFAHVGHGGHNSDGTASGNISVIVDGAVQLDGGSGVRSYAQIGHGGQNANGNRSGEIRVAASDLTVTGGTQAEAYALVGHGGVANGFLPTNNNYTAGTRTGSMWIDVAGTTTLADATTIGFLGHLGTGGTTAGSGLQLLTGQLDTTTSLRGVSGIIHSMSVGGVGIGVTNGDLLVNGVGASGNSSYGIDLLANGDVLFNSSVQNAGNGDVRVAGGWDGTTGVARDFVSPYPTFTIGAESVLADPALYGIGGAVVNVGTGAQARNVSVGSANGFTHIAGEAVNVLGSTTSAGGAAQIGFNEEVHRLLGGTNAVASTGDIVVHTKNGGLALQGGSFTSTSALIGHGGENTTATFAGDIEIDLGKGTAVGDLLVKGGTGPDSIAQIGHGGRRSQGAKTGNIIVNATDVDILAGSSAYTSARIGHGGGQGGGSIDGVIDIDAVGNVTIAGGSSVFSTGQIGHGGAAYSGAVAGAPVYLTVGQDLTLTGGSAVQTSAQVGHGGPLASGNTDGNLQVGVVGDIAITGGSGTGAYGQIGHGGVGSPGNRSGDITVSAGNDIDLGTAFGTSASYVKIGHGDDLDPSLASLGATGNWSGDITVGAGSDITLINAMIGHSNSVSRATTTGGTTQIGVSRFDPSAPSGGNLVADRNSEFAGAVGLRFYLPRRANNQIGSGALLNGTVYTGARQDPSYVQGDDEYTINIVGDQILFPNEHGNVFGTGPAPANVEGYAFYYDTIELFAAPVAPGDGNGDGTGGLGGNGDLGDDIDPDVLGVFTFEFDDEEVDDTQRKKKRFFRAFNPYSVLYEGYDHYGLNGESIYDSRTTNELDTATTPPTFPITSVEGVEPPTVTTDDFTEGAL